MGPAGTLFGNFRGLVLALVYLKALLFTAFCVLCSILVTWGMSEFLVNSFPPEAFVIAVIVPIVVATPLSIFIMRQQSKIDFAKRDLQAAMADLEKLHKEAERRARTDMMTGVWNREHFLSRLAETRRKQDEGALLMVDADRFKSINDTWGHQAGDEALIAIVGTICDTVREDDFVGRLGGEEFGIFLPGTSIDEAEVLAERLRKNIESLDYFPIAGHQHSLTISIGIAQTSSERSVSDLMKKADDLLYLAKEEGRNRIIVEGPSPTSKAA